MPTPLADLLMCMLDIAVCGGCAELTVPEYIRIVNHYIYQILPQMYLEFISKI